MLAHATPTLIERLLSKIVMPGPMTPCATWVGAYNTDGRKYGRRAVTRRPVIQLGRRGTPMVYVTPLLLHIAGVTPQSPAHREACHSCSAPADGVYRCVDLAHLRWDSRSANEKDKHRG